MKRVIQIFVNEMKNLLYFFKDRVDYGLGCFYG